MHQIRNQTSRKIPINRKGTKYVAKALSHPDESVPVVIAVRDMLKLAHTAREVRKMIQGKMLKINGRPVKDYRESIKLFNVFEADKLYTLTLLNTGRFVLKEVKKKEILCKVTNKVLVKKGVIQLNLHDGSNVLTKDKISVNDSVYLDFEGKIKSHVLFEKGKKAIIIRGKYAGSHGIINSIKNGFSEVSFEGKISNLNNRSIVVL